MRSSATKKTEVAKAKGVWKPGRQPGAGRKKGGTNARTRMLRAVADNAVKKGKSPLDIMLKNMRFYDDKATALLQTLEEKIVDMKTAPLELLQLLQEMSTFRMSAQKCACDAAPFVHPRLSAIAVKVSDDKLTRPPEDDMTDEQRVDYFNRLRLRPTSDAPLAVIIDNDTGEPVHADEDEEA